MKQRIGSDGRGSIPGLLLALQMNRLERNAVFFGNSFDYRDLLAVERALAGVIQHISRLVNMRMPGALLELGHPCFF